jgi:hypothetical protein
MRLAKVHVSGGGDDCGDDVARADSHRQGQCQVIL